MSASGNRFAAVGACARLAVAGAIVAALVTNLLTALDEGTWSYLIGYFTNQANAAFAVVLILGVIAPRLPEWKYWDSIRGAMVLYLVMTGLVYALLVAPPAELLSWDLDWQGIVLHRLAPLAAVADWLLAPQRDRSSAVRILTWLIYPAIFLIITWIRGAIEGWYPYEFLNPGAAGWPTVALTTAVVLVGFAAVASGVHAVGNVRARRFGLKVDSGHPGAGISG